LPNGLFFRAAIKNLGVADLMAAKAAPIGERIGKRPDTV